MFDWLLVPALLGIYVLGYWSRGTVKTSWLVWDAGWRKGHRSGYQEGQRDGHRAGYQEGYRAALEVTQRTLYPGGDTDGAGPPLVAPPA